MSDEMPAEGSRGDEGRSESIDARHALLINRDHVVGIEAEIGRLNRDLMQASGRARRAERRVASLVKRRNELRATVRRLRDRVGAEQESNAALKRRVGELEQQVNRPSVARRAARRLLRPGR